MGRSSQLRMLAVLLFMHGHAHGHAHALTETVLHSLYSKTSFNIIAIIQTPVLTAVVGLITSIIAPGAIFILPALEPIGSLRHTFTFSLTVWFSFNVILNFIAAATKPAGGHVLIPRVSHHMLPLAVQCLEGGCTAARGRVLR